ncbi:hypothetical protein DID75_02285 [Candidatus Marinamargulisbacteria bacterium SCGC AG-410-N11]|nr:hypothetical protein DID75_02285 [Candidatus Marinamargulisbacteria bacterium SCGC AG-410-N11]
MLYYLSMISKVYSASLYGLNALKITIEVYASTGLPCEKIIGLPDTIIKESSSRIKAAIKNSSFNYANKSYTINLAPADLPKEGSFLDVPIAAAILEATNQITLPNNSLLVGELSLSGSIKPIKGIIAICEMAKKNNIQSIYLPEANIDQAKLINNIKIFPLTHLSQFKNIESIKQITIRKTSFSLPKFEQDYSEVKGQTVAKRVMTIVATGFHNILLVGPPGSGKSMIIKRLPTIMPILDEDQTILKAKIETISKPFKTSNITPIRPFRSPHHSISYAGMVGGGRSPSPGEITLANNGILFLDEFPEFSKQVIEVLRQPLEDNLITISRASYNIQFPSNFILACTMNPCPCGYLNDSKEKCKCNSRDINKYWKKLSGPILDRIDIILDIPRLKTEDVLLNTNNHLSTASMTEIIDLGNKFQHNRNGPSLKNAALTSLSLNKFCNLSKPSKSLLIKALDNGILTGRSYDKILRVSRTIADIDQCKNIQETHILEALHYRQTKFKPT